ncbi:phytanoyl-CoA dioxygenase domain-containing protein 1-like [Haliotis rubra]|uniref:phytanoyl-CoA dioxygenase domain-containing protein 1-like n=1 Tax=Haliotis rubra TaxID=36100 RepID=UPI001EE535CD|nr:phytanoyl-CoA dioxygenase domain-containing protein 1-like [Haliotis rubra]
MDLEGVKSQFLKDGYAVIPNFLDDTDVSALRHECSNIINDMDPAQHHTVFSTTDQTNDDYFMTSGDKIRFFFEKGALDDKGVLQVDKQLSVNKIGHALHILNPVFRRKIVSNCTDEAFCLQDVLRAVGMVEPTLCQSMYIFKQPGIGGEVVPHQDSTFLHTTPLKLMGFWIALEDTTVDNGCLWFIPGSHKDGVAGNRRMIINPERGPGKPGTVFTGEVVTLDDKKFVPVEVKKGSLVLIHGEVVHKSEQNLSPRSRHVYTFHVYDQHNTEYSTQNWLQATDAKTFSPVYTTTQ